MKKRRPVAKLGSSLRLKPLTALLASLSVIVLGFAIIATRAATSIDPLAGYGSTVCGTWVLQQVDNAHATSYFTNKINPAMSAPHLRGLSIRAGWNDVDNNFALFDTYRAIYGSKMEMVRIMAGIHTPAAAIADGYYYIDSGNKVPLPFGADGSAGNPTFEAAYRTEVAALASWSRAHGIKVMHLPWYGLEWSEINYLIGVRSAPGFSYNAWLRGHENLVDIAMQYAGPDLAIEYPLSGSSSPQIITDLTTYILSKPGHQYVFVSANGWDPVGDWGAPTATIEAAKDAAAWNNNMTLLRAEQARVAGDDNWAAAFPAVYANKASYLEVYADAFNASAPHKADLLSNMATFDSTVCHPSVPTPPPGPGTGGGSGSGSGSTSTATKTTTAKTDTTTDAKKSDGTKPDSAPVDPNATRAQAQASAKSAKGFLASTFRSEPKVALVLGGLLVVIGVVVILSRRWLAQRWVGARARFKSFRIGR